jgi:hypothetical protein
MKFEYDYVWILRFNEEGMVVQGRSYSDTDLIRRAIEQDEKN